MICLWLTALAAMDWRPRWPFDYLWRPHNDSTLGPWTDADWQAAVSRLPAAGRGARAGLIYMQINPWAPWAEFLAHAAHANRAGVTVYFVGPRLPFTLSTVCPGCGWLPLNGQTVLDRLGTLGLRMMANRKPGPRKLCDFKPIWPAMLPEVSARHEWIGYADSDILFGDLASEVARLQPADELLVPASFFPQPLSNGNFLLMRSVPKMIRAYERSPDLRKMMLAFHYQGFDEWGLAQRGSMMSVYQEMLLGGELVARPTQRLLVQDAVIVTGAPFPTVDSFGANVSFKWADGKLVATRAGVCLCPDDSIPQFGLTFCDRCLAQRGSVLRDVITHRRVEILGFHFQEWKKRWRKKEIAMLTERAGVRDAAQPFAAPSCSVANGDGTAGFHMNSQGFRCGPQGAVAGFDSRRTRQVKGMMSTIHKDWPTGVDCFAALAPQLWGCKGHQKRAKGRRHGANGAK